MFADVSCSTAPRGDVTDEPNRRHPRGRGSPRTKASLAITAPVTIVAPPRSPKRNGRKSRRIASVASARWPRPPSSRPPPAKARGNAS